MNRVGLIAPLMEHVATAVHGVAFYLDLVADPMRQNFLDVVLPRPGGEVRVVISWTCQAHEFGVSCTPPGQEPAYTARPDVTFTTWLGAAERVVTHLMEGR